MKKQHFLISTFVMGILLFIQKEYQLINLTSCLSQMDTVLQSLVSILGSLLGFIVSTVAILAAVFESPLFNRLHRSEKTNELLSSFMSLIILTGTTLVFALLAQFTKNILSQEWVLAFILFSCLWWGLKFWYCMSLFILVLNIRFNPKSNAEPELKTT
jgi:hypothetical protein